MFWRPGLRAKLDGDLGDDYGRGEYQTNLIRNGLHEHNFIRCRGSSYSIRPFMKEREVEIAIPVNLHVETMGSVGL